MRALPSDEVLEKIADVLKALADPTRLRIIHVLQDGELCVSDILGYVGGSQANVSKHLSVLKRAGLVGCHREGLNVFYHISDEGVFAICRNVCDSLQVRLDRERESLAEAKRRMEGFGPDED